MQKRWLPRMIRLLFGSAFTPEHFRFTTQLFQEIHKNKRQHEVVNNVQYWYFYKKLGKESHEQSVLPADTTDDTIKTLHNNHMQKLSGSNYCKAYVHGTTQPIWWRMYNISPTTPRCAWPQDWTETRTCNHQLNKSTNLATDRKTSSKQIFLVKHRTETTTRT